MSSQQLSVVRGRGKQEGSLILAVSLALRSAGVNWADFWEAVKGQKCGQKGARSPV